MSTIYKSFKNKIAMITIIRVDRNSKSHKGGISSAFSIIIVIWTVCMIIIFIYSILGSYEFSTYSRYFNNIIYEKYLTYSILKINHTIRGYYNILYHECRIDVYGRSYIMKRGECIIVHGLCIECLDGFARIYIPSTVVVWS